MRLQHVRWQLPEGTTFADALVWSQTLHDAAHTILRRLGNARAQQVAFNEQGVAKGQVARPSHKNKSQWPSQGVCGHNISRLSPANVDTIFSIRPQGCRRARQGVALEFFMCNFQFHAFNSKVT